MHSGHTRRATRRVVAAVLTTVLVTVGLTVGATGASAAPDDAQTVFLADSQRDRSGLLPAGASTWSQQDLPSPVTGVVLDPTGATAYYASYAPPRLYRVDTASGALTGTLDIGPHQPWISGNPMALSPDGSTLYLAGYGGTVGVVDVASFTLREAFTFDGAATARQIRGVAVSPDGSRLYAADRRGNRVLVVDAATGTVTRTASLFNAAAIAVAPDGVVAVSSDTPGASSRPALLLLEPDGAVRASTPQATLGDNATNGLSDVAFSPDGSVLYGVTRVRGEVVEVDPATGALLTSPAPSGTTDLYGVGNHLALSSDGERLYLQHATGALRYDTAAHAFTSDLGATGTQNVEIALAPDQAPTAAFTVDPAPAGGATTFDGSASTAVTGSVATYAWDFGDGRTETTTTPEVSHVYDEAGTYTATLTVTSSGGTSTSVLFTGQAVARNGGPSAVTRRSVPIGSARTPVTPAPPVETPASCEGDPTTTVLVPDQPGVTYLAGGVPAGGGDRFTITADDPVLTLTAVAGPGAELAPGAVASWTFTYVDPGCDAATTEVTAAAPVETPATCTADPGAATIRIPAAAGVDYFRDGAPVSGTVTLTAADPELTVTAAARPGHVLTSEARWHYRYLEPDCPPLAVTGWDGGTLLRHAAVLLTVGAGLAVLSRHRGRA
ncbi:PKD domain-containing protein [Cellulomonas endometrii]|uniref:PKD domain-containing protein n=1 Tax=Cellulomonas endometrii TaxID=3036301 RepID=UPI0024ADD950|nr:PKD domain-containing protein [Cellulomonas endometrii]